MFILADAHHSEPSILVCYMSLADYIGTSKKRAQDLGPLAVLLRANAVAALVFHELASLQISAISWQFSLQI